MSRTANPVAVGAFVIGTLVLALLLAIFFGGGHWWSSRERFVLIYDTSIKGLNVGAPVTIKGVKIGEVVDIKAHMYENSLSILNSVVIEVDPDALEREGSSGDGAELMDELVKRGLRAQLRLQSLLTALLYVDVDFHPDKPAQYKDVKTRYKQLPTTPTDLEQLTRDLESIDINKLGENFQQIVDGVNELINDKALQHLVQDVSDTLASVRAAADQLNRQALAFGNRTEPLLADGQQTLQQLNSALPQLTNDLQQTLVALRQASESLQKTTANTTYLTSEDSPLIYRIDRAADSVNKAAEQVHRLTDALERQPESLIYGKRTEN
jgi:paraquat-inducible protein B